MASTATTARRSMARCGACAARAAASCGSIRCCATRASSRARAESPACCPMSTPSSRCTTSPRYATSPAASPMELTGQRQLSIDRAAAWAALNDPAILKASIPGCESIEKTGENEYAVAVATALGPVRARFRGKLRLEDAVATERYTKRFEGESGAAGLAQGSAQATLTDAQGGTPLTYTAAAPVGGRLPAVGNRLIASAAPKP